MKEQGGRSDVSENGPWWESPQESSTDYWVAGGIRRDTGATGGDHGEHSQEAGGLTPGVDFGSGCVVGGCWCVHVDVRVPALDVHRGEVANLYWGQCR